MKLKVRNINELNNTLPKISGDNKFLTSLALAKLFKSLEPELKAVEAQKNALITKYNLTANSTLEEVDALNKEFNEILDTDIEVSFVPINSALLLDLKLSITDMICLYPFIKEIEEPKEEQHG